MQVRVSEAYDNPEELVIRKARNDYKSEWVGELNNKEVIDEFRKEDESREEAKERFIIRTLINKGHFGPFEHPQISFEIKGVSRSLMAQITRHRPGITFDIQSQRYVDFTEKTVEQLFKMPQSALEVDTDNRSPDSRSIEEILEENDLESEEELQRMREEIMREGYEENLRRYRKLRKLGMPPEDARFGLPIGSKVNISTSMNARTLLHIADMRAQADAQWEVAELTKTMLDLAEEWMPITFGYYREEMIHRKNRLAP